MEDVTQLFAKYRECMRQLWNAYFRTLPDECKDWDLYDEYENIAVDVFSSLVLRPLKIVDRKLSPSYKAELVPSPGFRVIPSIEPSTPIMINRDIPPSGYYDHPVSEVSRNEVDLRLLQCFDFDCANEREYRYVKVLLRASAIHPEIVGRTALIDVKHASVIYQDLSIR